MTDSTPVLLFGSFTEDDTKKYQSLGQEPSPSGKKIQSPAKSVTNGFPAPNPAAASVARQNGSIAPTKGPASSNGRASANGKAADIAVDALGNKLGQTPKKQPARPEVAVRVGGLQPTLRLSEGKGTKPSGQASSNSTKASNEVPNGGAQSSAKLTGAGNRDANRTIRSPPRAVALNGSSPLSGKNSGEIVQSPAKHPAALRPIVPAAEQNGAAQSPSRASSGDPVHNQVNITAPETTTVEVAAENGDQAEWFVIDTDAPKDGSEDGREALEKIGANGSKSTPSKEQTPVVDKTGSEAGVNINKNQVKVATGDEEVEAVPAKLLPKSWAALVGDPAESKSGQKVSAGTKGKGKGSAGQSVASKSPLVEVAVVPVTEVSGETWLKSLRDAELVGRRLQPRGLINTGNSCFLNSTMQAMLSCSAFTHLLTVLKARSVPQTGYPTLRAFVEFSAEFESSPIRNLPKSRHDGDTKSPTVLDVGKPFAPAMFDSTLQSFTPDQPPRGTGRNRQEDAQEFLSFVIDRMHEEILQIRGKNSPSVLSVSSITSSEDDDWEMVGPKNRSAVTRTHTFSESAVTDIFGGQLRSVVKTKGNKASATVQPFLVLHLDIVPEVVHSVEDALRFFAAPESLEGYKPPSSKVGEVVSASKSVKIQKLPRVLILHLMRFSYGSGGSSKLHKPVHFPLFLMLGRELLASTTASGNEIRKYELVATLSHHGKDPSVGHYTADSKQPAGQWLRFDDGVVSEIGVNRVLQEQAYVLFYKRASF